ncbi:MAG: hypothetical protein NT033_04205 [Candidatus Omnitrophica bacterium]|nr:hypothetical protein [Candidatus Omnitrophota bacterium]
MNKTKLFKIATTLLAISFLAQVVTVVGMVFLKDLSMRLGVLGMLFEIHEYNGYLFVALVLVHLFLNWGWIRANIIKRR